MPTIRVTRGAIEVFSLDDQGKWPGAFLCQDGIRDPHVLFSCTDEQRRVLHGEAAARMGGGWDQPSWYSRTARIVFESSK